MTATATATATQHVLVVHYAPDAAGQTTYAEAGRYTTPSNARRKGRQLAQTAGIVDFHVEGAESYDQRMAAMDDIDAEEEAQDAEDAVTAALEADNAAEQVAEGGAPTADDAFTPTVGQIMDKLATDGIVTPAPKPAADETPEEREARLVLSRAAQAERTRTGPMVQTRPRGTDKAWTDTRSWNCMHKAQRSARALMDKDAQVETRIVAQDAKRRADRTVLWTSD
jgi:hypothetical protein